MKLNIEENLIIKTVVVITVVLAIVNAILLGFVNSKATALYQDKETLAEFLSKMSAALDKSPVRMIPPSDFMARDMLFSSVNTILKQVNNIVNQRDAMDTSLQSIADATHYATLNLSDTNDLKVIQSWLNELTEHSKKLFELNEKLSTFVLKIASLTDLSKIDQNNLKEKLKSSPEAVCLPILDNVEKNEKATKSSQQEIITKTNTISELKKAIEGASASQKEYQQIIQQKENELIQIKNEYLKLKVQFENTGKQRITEKISPSAEAAPVKKNSYQEFYYNLKGEVVEYNSKWGFIIINFGSDSKLKMNIGGEEKETNIPAPLDKEVYIARGDKFVAKAKIISVYSKYSVANIIFPSAEEIKKGDSVFFAHPKNNQL